MTTDLLLAHHLKQLRLPTIAKQYASLAREAVEHGLSYEGYLLALVEQETASREENQRQLRMRHATFPVPKTLDTFEFHYIPSWKFAPRSSIFLECPRYRFSANLRAVSTR